jgi:TatD DNase family protein
VFDSHCHLDLEAFAGDLDAAIARATAAGVTAMLVPATRPRAWPALLALARAHAAAGVRIALGVHPQCVPELDPDERAALADARLERTLHDALDAAGPLAVAVGECGLDGGTGARDEQARLLRGQLRVARDRALPAIVHVLRAHDEAPALLRAADVRAGGGVLHSYSGGAALVPIYRDLGLHFSFAGPVTYPGARRPVAAARAVPEELLLAETDAPDQAPVPHRGARCEPAHLPHVLAGLAAARGASVAELADVTARNARRLFRR